MKASLKISLLALIRNKKALSLLIFVILLPVIVSALNYIYSVMWLRVFAPNDDIALFTNIQYLFDNFYNFEFGILQSYYIFIFPLLIAVLFNINYSEGISTQTRKYNLIYNGFYKDFAVNFIILILSIILLLGINISLGYLSFDVFSHALHDQYPITVMPQRTDALIPAFQYAIIPSYVLLIIMSIAEYFFVRFLSTFSKNTYIATFLIVILHIIQFTPFIFVSSYYVIMEKLIYNPAISVIFAFPQRYISDNLLNSSIVQCCWVLGVTSLILLVLQLFRKRAYR